MKKKRGLILLLATLATVFTAGALSSCEGCGGCKPQSVIDYEEAHRDPVDYTVTVTKNIQEAGTVTGDGTFEEEETIQLLATANVGYVFEGWYNMSGVKVSSEPFYSFVLETNTRLVANWVIDPVVSEPSTPAEEVKVALSNVNGVAGVVAGGNTYDNGANVTITATANEGYQFVGWYDENGVNVSSATTYTFTATEDVTYSARWQVCKYQIATAKNIEDAGIVYGASTYEHGTSVTLLAVASEGYTFVGWYEETTQVSTNANYTFNATQDRTLTATWARNEYTVTANKNIDTAGTVTGAGSYEHGDDVTLTATASTGYTFVGWYNERGVQVSSDTSYTFSAESSQAFTAVWTLNVYEVTATKNIVGAGYVYGSNTYKHGAQVTLNAITNNGYVFDGWYVGEEKVSDSATYTFTATADKDVQAQWTVAGGVEPETKHTVTVTQNIAAAGTVTGAGEYDDGATVSLVATTNSGYVFDGWYVGEEKVSDSATYTFTATADKDVQAKWTAEGGSVTQYTITVNKNIAEAGDVTGAGAYAHDDRVTLRATTNDGYEFVGWYVDGGEVSTASQYRFNATADRTVEARWQLAEYVVSVVTTPTAAGTVTGADTYEYGTTATLEATTNSGYVFDGWYVGEEKVSDSETYTFTVEAETTVIAQWTLATYTVNVEQNIVEAGSVEVEDGYEHGTSVTLIATTNAGYEFVGWYDGTTQLSTSVAYTFTIEADTTLTANWKLEEYEITVESTNISAGTIEGADTYERGESVTLTAIPATGYEFVGWYDGTTQLSTEATYTFTAQKTLNVTAEWKLKEYTVSAEKNIEAAGSVTGAGTYQHNQTVQLLAVTNEHYTFIGWYIGGEEVSTDLMYEFTAVEGVTVEARWQINQYTVLAETTPAVGGSVSGAGTFDYGAQVTLTALTNVGYSFSGWWSGSTQLSAETTYQFTLEGNVTVKARWAVNYLTVTFNSDGGSNVSSKTVQEGLVVAKPNDPTKEGHSFAGWYNGTEAWDFENDVVMEETELKAKWTANDYVLTVEKNIAAAGEVTGGGTFTYGEDVTVGATSNAGYTWDGWYIGAVLQSSELEYTFTMGLDTTITAKWQGGLSGGEADTGDDEVETLVGQVAPAEPVYVIGKTGDLNVNVEELDAFTYVSIDKLTVAAEYYSFVDGLFTLKQTLMNTLALGQHVVRLHTDTGVCKFRVQVYKLATVVEGTNGDTTIVGTEVSYNQDNGADATFTMDFGGAPFVCVYINGNKAELKDYTLVDTTITITYEFIQENVADGVNEMIIETAAGQGVCTFNCTTEHIVASFDKASYKMQTATSQDVTFAFDPKGRTYEIKSVVDGAVTTVDASVYSYDEANTTLTIKGSYLDTLEADIYEFRADVADEENSQISFWVAAYGQEGKTIAYPTTTNAMNNFDWMTNGWACGQNVTTDEMFTGGATSMVVDSTEGAVSGKSLKVTSSYGTEVGWNTLLGYNLEFAETQRYLVKFKMSIDFASDATNGVFAVRFFKSLDGGGESVVNGVFINVDANGANGLSEASDVMTSYVYDSATGVYDVSVYMTPNAAGQAMHFTAINLGYCSIYFDDLQILAVGESDTSGLVDYDFEDKTTGAGMHEYGLSTIGAVGEVVETDVINGNKSLKLTSTTDGAAAAWNVMLKSDVALTAGDTYLLRAKVKYTLPTGVESGSIAFRFVGSTETNGLILNVNSGEVALGEKSDAMTAWTYDSTTGVISVSVYMTATSDDQKLNITTITDVGGEWTLIVDDVKLEKTVASAIKYDFENETEGAWNPVDTLNNGLGSDAAVITSGAISGTKSLQLTTNATGTNSGWNIMMYSNFGAVQGTRYLVNIKFKLATVPAVSGPQIWLRLVNDSDEQINGLVINATDGSQQHKEEAASTYTYDSATGIVTASVYMTSNAAGQKFYLTTVGGGNWTLIVDDFSIGTPSDISYDVTAESEDTAKGTVSGGGTFTTGEQATVTATPATGYLFDGWYVGETKVSTSTTYTFIVEEEVALVAKFVDESSVTSYTVTAGSEDETKGTVEGSGKYADGTLATVKATANAGYTFEGWYVSGSKVSSSATYSFAVDADVTVTAKFVVSTYTITVTATTGGNVTGGGTFEHGANVVLTATAETGYVFEGWYDESSVLVESAASYTFKANNNVTLTARFTPLVSAVDPVSVIVADEFDNGGDTFVYSDKLNAGAGADPTILTSGALVGTKSLKLTTNSVGVNSSWNIMMMSDFNAGYARTYVISMKVKIESVSGASSPQVFFRMVNAADAQVNGLVLNTDGTIASQTDSRTTATYDSTTGVYTVNAYMTTNATDQIFYMTTVGGGTWSLIVDDFIVKGLPIMYETFESITTFNPADVLNAGPGADASITTTEAIVGNNALQLVTNATGASASWNVMMSSSFGVQVGERYLIQMKYRYTMASSLTSGTICFRLVEEGGAEVNGLFLNVAGGAPSAGAVSESGSTFFSYDATTGITTVGVYMTATSANQVFHMTTVGGDIWSLIVDEFAITPA